MHIYKFTTKTVAPDNHHLLLTKHFNKLYNHNANVITTKQLIFSLTWLNQRTCLLTKMANNNEMN